MRLAPVFMLALLLAASGCALSPFESGHPDSKTGGSHPGGPAPGSGPVITSVPEVGSAPAPGAESGAFAQPAPLPRERPKVTPATLGPASRSLVTQAQTQRKKGDLPGATVSLERALRIEPNNPLLWIEMGRLRMDQQNRSLVTKRMKPNRPKMIEGMPARHSAPKRMTRVTGPPQVYSVR